MNFILLLLLLIISQEINSTKDGYMETVKTTMSSNLESNKLPTHRLDRNGIRNVNRSKKPTDENLSRVKRQYNYDPYYRRRNRYPYPLPVVIGGGFALGGIGGRGFGGRGFGGRGFGGRGIGGFGGRGIGGIGGRGIGGGGRGGGRG